jgi:hypothetical protein
VKLSKDKWVLEMALSVVGSASGLPRAHRDELESEISSKGSTHGRLRLWDTQSESEAAWSALGVLFNQERLDLEDSKRMEEAGQCLSEQAVLHAAKFTGGAKPYINIIVWCVHAVAAWLWDLSQTTNPAIPSRLRAIMSKGMVSRIVVKGERWLLGLMGITGEIAKILRWSGEGQAGQGPKRIYTSHDAACASQIRQNIVLPVKRSSISVSCHDATLFPDSFIYQGLLPGPLVRSFLASFFAADRDAARFLVSSLTRSSW